jgi:hypothetical protein
MQKCKIMSVSINPNEEVGIKFSAEMYATLLNTVWCPTLNLVAKAQISAFVHEAFGRYFKTCLMCQNHGWANHAESQSSPYQPTNKQHAWPHLVLLQMN